MTNTEVPLGGLFQANGATLAPGFDGGLRWDFPASDLNKSARSLFRHLDRVFDILQARECVFLSTIELDVEAGRFPDVVAQYFRDEPWADTQSFFVAPIKSTNRSNSFPIGRLTYEAIPGQTVRVLGQNGGFRWGSALRVWGLQVPRAQIADVIELSTDDAAQLNAVHRVARAAWLASPDLDALGLWISLEIHDDARRALTSIPTA
jgi:hypothetical protein